MISVFFQFMPYNKKMQKIDLSQDYILPKVHGQNLQCKLEVQEQSNQNSSMMIIASETPLQNRERTQFSSSQSQKQQQNNSSSANNSNALQIDAVLIKEVNVDNLQKYTLKLLRESQSILLNGKKGIFISSQDLQPLSLSSLSISKIDCRQSNIYQVNSSSDNILYSLAGEEDCSKKNNDSKSYFSYYQQEEEQQILDLLRQNKEKIEEQEKTIKELKTIIERMEKQVTTVVSKQKPQQKQIQSQSEQRSQKQLSMIRKITQYKTKYHQQKKKNQLLSHKLISINKMLYTDPKS